ncbi:MAG: thiol oxidoreductase [Acidobacteria bacterium]|nr:thiol oxidoreductase [Acidobacteriota bacterium]
MQQADGTGNLPFFNDGLSRFLAVENVSNADDVGLGPRFNSNSCVSCHAFPAPGGSSAPMNPQFAFAGSPVAPLDKTPPFITANGPTREARFPFQTNADGTPILTAPAGGVVDLFTVSGRADAGSCSLAQPNFQQAAATNNLIFRIPTPTYGLGLIENLSDATLMANRAASLNNNLGISGHFNFAGNDGTITRFGWKAQNPSGWVFSAEAYNVEEGVTNLGFNQERRNPNEGPLPDNCMNLSGQGYPEDTSNPLDTTAVGVLDDVSGFANFMRMLAPPMPGAVSMHGNAVGQNSLQNGQRLFSAIGCAVCHTPTMGPTQQSGFTPALANKMVNAFSDFEVHHMGGTLADNVSQGAAGGDEFRTAPLWGVGQRLFFLHDGRTSNLVTAIEAHASNGSEANQVISNFNNLRRSDQQDLVNFLRSL